MTTTFSLTNNFTKNNKINVQQFLLDVSNAAALSAKITSINVQGDSVILTSTAPFNSSDLSTLSTVMANHDTTTSVIGGAVYTPTATENYVPSSNGQYMNASNPSQITSTSTNWTNVLTLITPYILAGDYEIQFYFNWQNAANASTIQAQGLIDGVTPFFNFAEKVAVLYNTRNAICSGFNVVTLTSGVHQLVIQFSSGTNGQLASVSNCRLRVMKIN